MKRVTVLLGNSSYAAFMQAIATLDHGTLQVESIPESKPRTQSQPQQAIQRPRKKLRRNGRRIRNAHGDKKTAADYLFDTFADNQPFTRQEAKSVIAKRRYSKTSLSPLLATLIHEGYARKFGPGDYRFVKRPKGLYADRKAV